MKRHRKLEIWYRKHSKSKKFFINPKGLLKSALEQYSLYYLIPCSLHLKKIKNKLLWQEVCFTALQDVKSNHTYKA